MRLSTQCLKSGIFARSATRCALVVPILKCDCGKTILSWWFFVFVRNAKLKGFCIDRSSKWQAPGEKAWIGDIKTYSVCCKICAAEATLFCVWRKVGSHFYYYGYKKIRACQYRQDPVLFAWKIGAVQIHATPEDSALLSVSRRENPKGKKRERETLPTGLLHQQKDYLPLKTISKMKSNRYPL